MDNKELKQAIADTLAYFGLFRYPLRPDEIHRFVKIRCSLAEVEAQLSDMKTEHRVHVSSLGFYSLLSQPDWSQERKNGNERAEALLKKMPRFARRIKSFPFVESIAISGSLSKYYADREADIDYFIITKKNRLWIARTLLHAYKKLTFLRGHEHFYCMNYFVDETALEIPDKNIYTAIEIVTLIPVFNADAILGLKQENPWLFQFLPNENLAQDERFLLSPNKGIFRRFFEFLIELLPADKLNIWLMRLTDRKWRAKWQRKSYPMDNYNQAMFTSVNVSKNHPANYQDQVLHALEKKESLAAQPTCTL